MCQPSQYNKKKPKTCTLLDAGGRNISSSENQRDFKLISSHDFSVCWFLACNIASIFPVENTGSGHRLPWDSLLDKPQEWQPWAVLTQTAARQSTEVSHLNDRYPCGSHSIWGGRNETTFVQHVVQDPQLLNQQFPIALQHCTLPKSNCVPLETFS